MTAGIGPRLLVCASLTMLAACAEYDAEPGAMQMAIASTGPDGATYRLRDALFFVNGPDSTVLDSELSPSDELIRVGLAAGDYTIELAPGWRLERGVGGAFSDIPADLLSDNPRFFTIEPQQSTNVIFRLGIEGGEVEIGPGELGVGIDVEILDGGVPFTDASWFPPDAGTPPDAGPSDAGFPPPFPPDAGPLDAGFPPPFPSDAGPSDAGFFPPFPFDAGPPDAGSR